MNPVEPTLPGGNHRSKRSYAAPHYATTEMPSPVDPRTGIIHELGDLPWAAGEPEIFNCFVRMARTERYLGVPCYDMNGGAGLTLSAARAAAVGEGLERYCASVYDPAELKVGNADELAKTHRVAPPGTFALFHPSQGPGFPTFDNSTRLAWVTGRSLISDEQTLVPACLVYMPYHPQEAGEVAPAPAISTGLACARSYPEAVLGGLYECFERDAFVIHWMNRITPCRIAPEAEGAIASVYHERLAKPGLHYTLLDVTLDPPVPSYFCVLIDDRNSVPMISVGGASSFDTRRAQLKAMMEAAQTREWAKVLPAEGATALRHDAEQVRTFEDHVALYAHGGMLEAVEFLLDGPVVQSRQPQTWAGSTDAALHRAIGLLHEAGLDAIVIDLTTPDTAQCGFCVVKVVIPELQPLDADYRKRFLGGRRLYELPRRLGFSDREVSPADLNPDPHPYP
ncbi:YcaO-like family protein [Pseudarthrobacter albicanus]|uniref:YcaO-like family protein n=1 Tax=Pseudarthrobacter albicanus TaxID=2823873 RepID=UPI001BA75814|nr:YcaO-like family protein [Pseudarthrobacter albicanus]